MKRFPPRDWVKHLTLNIGQLAPRTPSHLRVQARTLYPGRKSSNFLSEFRQSTTGRGVAHRSHSLHRHIRDFESFVKKFKEKREGEDVRNVLSLPGRREAVL